MDAEPELSAEDTCGIAIDIYSSPSLSRSVYGKHATYFRRSLRRTCPTYTKIITAIMHNDGIYTRDRVTVVFFAFNALWPTINIIR